MATKITDQMLIIAAGSFLPEAVGKVRRLLAAAGVTDIELHRHEVEAVRTYREKARSYTAMAEKLLAAGPLPDHGCIVDDHGLVTDAGDCPYGCKPQGLRLGVD